MSDSAVKVAVRVRPFNTRERNMNSTCCLKMIGAQTIIYHPETKKEKKFTFDFSYWSHDGYKELEDGTLIATNKKYAGQQDVYDNLGQMCLNNAFTGYNSTLFAYGQTGSGKSYSMVGYGPNKGIIPIVCSEMFKKIDEAADDPTQAYRVSVSMLEIYNEQIRDLLNPKVNIPGGLKIRSKPGVGVYVERLTPVAVASYKEIEAQMENGTTNRTIGSTNMNATSSRAHTVFGIMFTSLKTDLENDNTAETTARLNLVDLAGSERADSTGATGDRLKEGCAINASLSALGNVISALADKAMGKKKVFVPYRNSALTRLLQDALGGNSKTIMIAALSPASVNYDETLSTLRYADRAKKIKNMVVKMENPTDKIIRLLKEENEKLKALLEGQGIDTGAALAAATGGGGGAAASPEEIEKIRMQMQEEHEAKLQEQMAENERMLKEMQKSWEEKLKDSAALVADSSTGAVSVRSAASSKNPRMVNLHEDPQLSECLVYPFKDGKSVIGNRKGDPRPDIVLNGLSIKKHHAEVVNEEGKIVLTCLNKSKTFVNGQLVKKPVELKVGDRIIIGNNFVFRFEIPGQECEDEKVQESFFGESAFEHAMEEFQTAQGNRLSQLMSGDMFKSDPAEAKRRQELEDKLRQLEEEKEEMKMRLQQQKAIYEGKGDLAPEEMEKMKDYETEYSQRSEKLQAEIEKRRAAAEKIIQQQMKRKRQTRKLEQELAKLLPMISEANEMAKELEKTVRFEARLAVKSTTINLSALDEVRNLKTIEVNIRVTSTTNGNVWTWSTEKFESRLFIMRELYQEWMNRDSGDPVAEIQKSKDPFWDPPEAIEIGKAYVYLKALSQLVEIENEFKIVDYKGETQGSLAVDVYPEGPNGEEMDYYLESPDELVGMNVSFVVRVPFAKDIPSKYSNDVYVSFTFDQQTLETEVCEVKTNKPKWSFQHRFVYDSVTEEFKNYLLKDAAVFEVKGFSDQQSDEIVSATQSDEKGPPKCEQCDESIALSMCIDCTKKFCDNCFKLLHKAKSKRNHRKKALQVDDQTRKAAEEQQSALTKEDGGSDGMVMCGHCGELPAEVNCKECAKPFCTNCNRLFHKAKRKATHERTPVNQPSGGAESKTESKEGNESAAPVCSQCEENQASKNCDECSRVFCDSCDAILHKSKKKREHNRSAL